MKEYEKSVNGVRAAMGTSHVTVNYRNGDHDVQHIYKLDSAVAQQMTQLPPNTTGQQLDAWCKAHGGKLDDKNGIPASIRTYDDGHSDWTSYSNGKALQHGTTPPDPPAVDPPASKMMAPPAEAQNRVGMLSLGGFTAATQPATQPATTQPATQPATGSKFATASTLTASGASFTIEADKPPVRRPTTQPSAGAPR
jgi:hypothetical protein